MPSSGRKGGRRQGKPGVAYRQRVDLNDRVPVVAAKGGTYGSGVESEEVQRAIQSAAPAPAPVQRQAAPQGFSRVMPPISGPTMRPDEPITAGLPMGPGPGPEALGLAPPGPNLERLRPMLPVFELLASSGNVDSETINMVRRLRGALGAG